MSIKNNIDIKKYKPPNHCDVDRQSNKLWSKYLTFSKIENPVEVNPDTASNKLLIKDTLFNPK